MIKPFMRRRPQVAESVKECNKQIVKIDLNTLERSSTQTWDIAFGDNYVFHISWRKECSTIVLNEKISDKYLRESRIPYALLPNESLLLNFSRQSVDVSVSEVFILTRELAADLTNLPRGKCEEYGYFDLTDGDEANGSETILYSNSDILNWTSIFDVPLRALSPVMISQLDPIKVDTIRIFIEASKIFTFEKHPIFIDISNTMGALSSIISTCFPNVDIYCIYSDLQARDQAKNLLADDKFRRVCFVNHAEVNAKIRSSSALNLDGGHNNHICIVGANLFGELRDEYLNLLNSLSSISNTITVIANEIAPIPSYMVFSNDSVRDVYINVFESSWKFIWDAQRRHMQRPKLDIIVAAYDAKAYIKQCVESLASQRRDDVQIVIIDDGSTDDSQEIFDQLCSEISNVTVYRKPNGGCASARNYGRLKSSASHCAFVDADDYVDAGSFDCLFDLALYSGEPVVQFGFQTDGLSTIDGQKEQSDENIANKNLYKEFLKRKIVRLSYDEVMNEAPGIWRRVYRRDFLDGKNIWFPEHIRAYDDFIFFVFTIHYAGLVLHMNDFKYHYRQHANQDVRKRDARHFYVLEMGHMILQRAMTEGWNNISVLVNVLRASIIWSLSRVDLRYLGTFVTAAASLVALIETTFGKSVFKFDPEEFLPHPDFRLAYRLERENLVSSNLDSSYAGSLIKTWHINAEIVDAVDNIIDKRLR